MCDPISLETHYDDDLQKAVGFLFLSASNVEAALGMQVARCYCAPHMVTPQSALMCAGADLSLKLQQINICVLLLAPDEYEACCKLTASIRRQFDHRNALAHNSNWGPGNRITITRLKVSGKKLTEPKIFNASQITNFGRIMYLRCFQLDALLTKAGLPKLTEFDPTILSGQANPQLRIGQPTYQYNLNPIVYDPPIN